MPTNRSSEVYYPGQQQTRDRKERFKELNDFVMAKGGWITSIPGAAEVTMECLPGSTLPHSLQGLGYDVVEIGEGVRILTNAIVEHFVVVVGAALEPLTAGSTRPVALTVTHAGVAKVRRYGLNLYRGS
ncbi:hypothetical protein ACFQZO_23930 [Bradyrhizobium sp. GCM10027634]|uniref:hypothetical protein n=1 Tax=unclassified Bradyrhizobium TaxID=2631580 RepID=UPI00188CA527|nr:MULTISPECIES: hypothetical protein [unclassified Bradyrhizobium]MDN5003890.1 hypothetical protein [Bradyrhizobium sp. WYCCWR 12677]QOZ45448.1 hypothetical protein XH89_19620 [Bradyrhizobium sp. CCBAU 53340]